MLSTCIPGDGIAKPSLLVEKQLLPFHWKVSNWSSWTLKVAGGLPYGPRARMLCYALLGWGLLRPAPSHLGLSLCIIFWGWPIRLHASHAWLVALGLEWGLSSAAGVPAHCEDGLDGDRGDGLT